MTCSSYLKYELHKQHLCYVNASSSSLPQLKIISWEPLPLQVMQTPPKGLLQGKMQMYYSYCRRLLIFTSYTGES